MVARDKKKACIRCGILREPQKGRLLCPDCRLVLSTAERALWLDDEPAVESYHEKEVA